MRFAFIHAEKASFPVSAMCRLLERDAAGLLRLCEPASESARRRPMPSSARRIREVLRRERQAPMGARACSANYARRANSVGKRRVERAMRGMGLRRLRRVATARRRRAIQRTPSRPTCWLGTSRRARPNERWVTDITYVWTDEGWLYLAAILDLFSRASSAGPSTRASRRACRSRSGRAMRRRRPGAGLLHHSDRGCQYTSDDYRDASTTLGITVSMSRKGNCWDNAVAESFFGTLKNELIYQQPWRNASRAARSDLRVHRGLLQSSPSSLVSRLQDTQQQSRDSTLDAAA